MWPFNKKPRWPEQYAHTLYEGLVEHNEFGNINAITLRIPTAMHGIFQNKILSQREMLCLSGLAVNLGENPNLRQVAREFIALILSKMSMRGLQLSEDQLTELTCNDLELLMADPLQWGRDWLAEFRNDPNDTTMAALFGEHCLRLYTTYKQTVAKQAEQLPRVARF